MRRGLNPSVSELRSAFANPIACSRQSVELGVGSNPKSDSCQHPRFKRRLFTASEYHDEERKDSKEPLWEFLEWLELAWIKASRVSSLIRDSHQFLVEHDVPTPCRTVMMQRAILGTSDG